MKLGVLHLTLSIREVQYIIVNWYRNQFCLQYGCKMCKKNTKRSLQNETMSLQLYIHNKLPTTNNDDIVLKDLQEILKCSPQTVS